MMVTYDGKPMRVSVLVAQNSSASSVWYVPLAEVLMGSKNLTGYLNHFTRNNLPQFVNVD